MSKTQRELSVVQANPKSVIEPLRYHDPELQVAWNIEPADPERLQRAMEKSKRLHAEYLEQLKRLRPRLNERTYARFSAERDPLFDNNLLEFTFGDRLGFAELRRKKRPRLAVRVSFLAFEGDKLHELHYRDVDTLHVKVPQERWFDMGGYKEIDSLLAHELTSANVSLMSHRFLFASGAAIAITFAEVFWGTRSVKRSSPGR
jgi:hypothetical protein